MNNTYERLRTMPSLWQILYKSKSRTSLVVQWLRIRLPVRGTQVPPLPRKIPCAAGKPSLQVTTTEPTVPQLLEPTHPGVFIAGPGGSG